MSSAEPPIEPIGPPEPVDTVTVEDQYEEPAVRLEHFLELVDAGDDAGLADFLSYYHASDVADLIEELEEEDRIHVLGLLPVELASETLTEMEYEEHPEDLLAALGPERILELVSELSDDDAVDLIGELEPDEQARVLAALPKLDAAELQRLLQYDEESAGGLMTTELVAVRVDLTASDAIEEVRRQAQEIGGDFYTIFVVDAARSLVGTVTLQELVIADPRTLLADLVEEPAATVTVDEDQEEVGRLISRYNLPSIGVVGPNDVLVGRITWDDVIDVMEMEQTEDLLKLAGVGAEEEVRGAWTAAVRSRFPWLFLNLFTAGAAAAVVALFEGTIERAWFLAVIMPVIAGMGGNAGTQALAVTVRRLATTEETAARRFGVAAKELVVGLVNGLALGILVGVAAWMWQGTAMLGAVVLLAMWGNLVIASVAGAWVPILLERAGADPAVASSIFVTTCTDLAGFFLLLGLASKLLL